MEKAIDEDNPLGIDIAIQKVLLMQAFSFFLGGVPMLFYGDEAAYTNDYSYLDDPGKSYDNRWMHRPFINWDKNKLIDKKGSIENKVFSGTQKLINIRKKLEAIGDYNNLVWLNPYNIHIAGYLRMHDDQAFYGVFNFNSKASYLNWRAFKEHGIEPANLYDHWNRTEISVGKNEDFLIIEPYGFHLLEVR